MRSPSTTFLAGAIVRGYQTSNDCRCDAAVLSDNVSIGQKASTVVTGTATDLVATSGWDDQQQVHHQLLQLLPSQQVQQQWQEQKLSTLPLAVVLAHKQRFLLRSLPLQQQPLCRKISTSVSQQNRWGTAPRLHKPSQHIQGTDPLRIPKVASSPTIDAGAIQDAATAAAADAAPANSTASEPWHARLRSVASNWRSSVGGAQYFIHAILGLGVCITVYLVLQTVILSSSKGNLQSKDPVAVSSAVRNLRWLMSRDLAVRFVEKGLVPDLVALVQPGTDAITLNQVLTLLDQLLSYGAEVREAVVQSNLLGVLKDGLKRGWLPRGAADSADALRSRVQKLQQRRLPDVK